MENKTVTNETEFEEALAPAENPDIGQKVPGLAPEPRGPEIKHHIKGEDLIPDLERLATEGGTLEQYRYWVGVTPSCPVESIDLAGINFPKVNELLVDDPLRTGQRKRIPVIGAVVWLTEHKIRLMSERLSRVIIRFTQDKGEQNEAGTGQNVGDNHRRPRRGKLITIPTKEEIEQRRKAGKATREVHFNPKTDVPAARFMFAQLCGNQEHGSRGEYYPQPLEITGLGWPDEMEVELAGMLD